LEDHQPLGQVLLKGCAVTVDRKKHFPFSIFHLLFLIADTDRAEIAEMKNENSKMENGKWI
jgi:hypothetical protein